MKKYYKLKGFLMDNELIEEEDGKFLIYIWDTDVLLPINYKYIKDCFDAKSYDVLNNDEVTDFIVDETYRLSKLYKKADDIQQRAHRGQVDKGGSPYYLHPQHVALHTIGLVGKIIALLHDVVEDTEVTLDDLIAEGFDDKIVSAVGVLTRDPATPYEEHIKLVKSSYWARPVKISDIQHNIDMSRIPNPTSKDWERRDKYLAALNYLVRND